MQAAAIRAAAERSLSDDEQTALIDQIYNPNYSEHLLTLDLTAAWIGGQLVGTAAWSAGDDQGTIARISGVCTMPAFAGVGLGRRLVADTESRAARAGFRIFTAEAPRGAAAFFERLGYTNVASGVSHGPGAVRVPVAFLRKSLAGVIALSANDGVRH